MPTRHRIPRLPRRLGSQDGAATQSTEITSATPGIGRSRSGANSPSDSLGHSKWWTEREGEQEPIGRRHQALKSSEKRRFLLEISRPVHMIIGKILPPPRLAENISQNHPAAVTLGTQEAQAPHECSGHIAGCRLRHPEGHTTCRNQWRAGPGLERAQLRAIPAT